MSKITCKSVHQSKIHTHKNTRFDLGMNILWFYILLKQTIFTQPFFSSHIIKAKEWKTSFTKVKELLVPVVITNPVTEYVDKVRQSPRIWELCSSSLMPEGSQTHLSLLAAKLLDDLGCNHSLLFSLWILLLQRKEFHIIQLEEGSKMKHIHKLLCYPLFPLFGPLNPKFFAVKQICISSRSLYWYRLQRSSQDTCLGIGKWEFYFNEQRGKLKVSPLLTTRHFVKKLCMARSMGDVFFC